MSKTVARKRRRAEQCSSLRTEQCSSSYSYSIHSKPFDQVSIVSTLFVPAAVRVCAGFPGRRDWLSDEVRSIHIACTDIACTGTPHMRLQRVALPL